VLNQTNEAQWSYERAWVAWDHPFAKYTQSLLLLKYGMPREAQTALSWLVRNNPGYTPAYLALAAANYALGELRQAEQQAAKYVHSPEPVHPYGKELLASIRLDLAEGTRVLATMDPASSKEIFNSVVAALASSAYYQMPDFANATKPLERASRLKTPNL
jgi:tetratricopeptide (TPR) repeat protein